MSTLGATTNGNYKKNRRKQARKKQVPWFAAIPDDRPEKPGSKIFTAEIESGIFTHATWTVIQAMPREIRQEYEELAVDSVAFFSKDMIASTVEEYHQLCDRYRGGGPGWRQELHDEDLALETWTRPDERNVAIRVQVQEFAELTSKLRNEAKTKFGKGHALELAWKLIGNATFGVTASEDLATNNFIAANVVTSTARACTWVMTQVANGHQPITDGTVYRRDQVPRITFAECIARRPDYTMSRADAGDGVEFLDPQLVPENDEQFVAWYRSQAMAFFETHDEDFRKLISLHGMEHKAVEDKLGAKTKFFDGFILFGAGDNIMLLDDADGPHVASVKLRSYGKSSKDEIVPWIVAAATGNTFTEPAPIATEKHLLRYKEAVVRVGSALSASIPEVVFPLGYDVQQLRKIAIIRDSGFLCHGPKQFKSLKRAVTSFRNRTGCGLELLTLGAGRGRGKTIEQICSDVYKTIARGATRFTSALNLGRPNTKRDSLATTRKREITARSATTRANLRTAMDVRNHTSAAKLTGLRVRRLNH